MSIIILNLNNDIIEIILKYLDDIDVMNFYKTCKSLYYSNFDYEWKEYYDIIYWKISDRTNKANKHIYKILAYRNVCKFTIYNNDDINILEHYIHNFSIKNSVISLKFDCNQILNIPNSVTIKNLIFGDNYNQITNISNSVKDLTFGRNYNQITTIPN